MNNGERLQNSDRPIKATNVGYDSHSMLICDGDLVHSGLAWSEGINFRIHAYGDRREGFTDSVRVPGLTYSVCSRGSLKRRLLM